MENLQGGSGDDTFIGNSSSNTLEGGAGDDWLSGKSGSNLLDGGANTAYTDGTTPSGDTADYSSITSGVGIQANMNAGTDGANLYGEVEYNAEFVDTLKDIENIRGSKKMMTKL